MDAAKKIRETLKKELGLGSRDVSVRTRHYTSISVDIKTEKAIKFADRIEEIAKENESYRVDEYNGEILAGGNTFVFVRIDESAYDGYIEKARELIKEADDKDGYYVDYKNVSICRPTGQMGNINYWVKIETDNGLVEKRVDRYEETLAKLLATYTK